MSEIIQNDINILNIVSYAHQNLIGRGYKPTKNLVNTRLWMLWEVYHNKNYPHIDLNTSRQMFGVPVEIVKMGVGAIMGIIIDENHALEKDAIEIIYIRRSG